jgi:hypothetical protein
MRALLLVIVLAAALPAAAAEEKQQIIPWDEAEKHVGKEMTVEGRVVDIHCGRTACLLAFEPSFNRFTAVIQASSFDTFPPEELKKKFQGKRVRVSGKIKVREKKPEIIVDSTEELALASVRRKEERQAARLERAQAEMLERLTEMLTRVEDVSERLAEIEDRLEALTAHLEQRETALAEAQAAPPPPPPPAPEPPPIATGEAQPRPAYESLRTVKRGMSRNDVERLVGQPEYVESAGSGWTTWYYGYGRSVSFDARGRAQAVVGFPPP